MTVVINFPAAGGGSGSGGGGGSTTFVGLTDASTANIPSINTPTATSLLNKISFAANWAADTNVVTGVPGTTSLSNSSPGAQTTYSNTKSGTTAVAYLGAGITSVAQNDKVAWNSITSAWELFPFAQALSAAPDYTANLVTPLASKVGILSNRGIPIGMIGNFTFAANGVMSAGVVTAGTTLTISATTGSVTITATGGTPFTAAMAAAATVQVITLDGGKQITITAFTSSSIVTGTISGGTLSGLVFTVWTLFQPVKFSQFGSTFYGPGGSVFPGCYLFFPANSITGSNTAGLYWTVFSNSTFATVFNNTYTPGTLCTIPVSPTAFSAAAGAVTANNITTDITADSILIPANSLGPNGKVRCTGVLNNNNSVNNKRMQTKIGTNVLGVTLISSTVTINIVTGSMYNSGTGTQWSMGTDVGSSTGAIAGVAANDTTTNITMSGFMQLPAVTDWLMSISLTAEILPG